MDIQKVIKVLLLSCAFSTVIGCSSKSRSGHDAGLVGVADATQFYGSEITPEQEQNLLAQRTYYFAHDRAEVSEKDMMSVYAHAKHLMESPKRRIRLEGHTDELGSPEYNVALGERRAKAVANVLMMKGVPQSQISVVSYGKERPVALDHNDAAWQLNRRAEIVYEVE